jgi:hypothetical protein
MYDGPIALTHQLFFLQVDGALVQVGQQSGSPLNLFLSAIGLGTQGSTGFVGAIDELRIYSRGLLPSEIANSFTAGTQLGIVASV